MNAECYKMQWNGQYDEAKYQKFIERETAKILKYKAKGHRDFQCFTEESARKAAESLANINRHNFRLYTRI